MVQLGHGGSYKTLEVARGSRTVSPSGVRFPGTNLMSQKITTFEITKLRSDFADAALRAKKGGADGVQIHGGHGFLLNEFLSPILNKRDDRYGGTLQNRERIFLEVYEKVRETVGKSFPIFFKLSIEEGISGGYPAEEGMDLAKNLLKAGVDGIEVSSGTPYADIKHLPSMIGVSAGESEAPFKRFSEELKKCVVRRDQVIILCGGLRSLSTMSQLVTDGVCDMVSMSRPLNCEPDLINRWAEEDDRPSACISCNACFKTAAHGMINCPVMRNRNEGNWDAL